MPAFATVILLLLLALPLLEIAVLIKVCTLIGVFPTLMIVVATGFIGSAILSNQGFTFVNLMREAMRTGRPPLEPVIEAGLRGFAGGCLLLPGLIGDAVGFALLVPPFRVAVARLLHDRVIPRAFNPASRTYPAEPTSQTPTERTFPDAAGPGPKDRAKPPPVIDGDFTRID